LSSSRRLALLFALSLAAGYGQQATGVPIDTYGFAGTNPLAFSIGIAWLLSVAILCWDRPQETMAFSLFQTSFTAWKPVDLPLGTLRGAQLVGVIAFGQMLLQIYQRRMRSIWMPYPLLVFLGILVLGCLQSILIDPTLAANAPILRSIRSDPVIRALTSLPPLFVSILGYLALVSLPADRPQLRRYLAAMVAGVAVNVGLGLIVWLLAFIGLPAPFPITMLGNFGSGILSRELDIGSGGRGDILLRLSSFAIEPRHLAYLIAPALVGLAIFLLRQRDLRRRQRYTALAILALQVIGFGLTLSRTSYLLAPLLLAIICLCSLQPIRSTLQSHRRVLSRVLVAGLAVALIGFTSFGAAIAGFFQAQFQSVLDPELAQSAATGVPIALDAYSTAWMMFIDSPLFGYGTATYVYGVTKFGLEFAIDPTVNNLFLQLLAENGLIGLAAFSGVFLWHLKEGYNGTRSAVPQIRVFAWSLIGAAVTQFICFLFWDTLSFTYFWTCLALIVLVAKQLPDQLAAPAS
jgi:O-antigen ligase